MMTEKDYFNLPALKTRILKRRRHLSITLKIPDIGLGKLQSPSVRCKRTVEIIRTSSVSDNYKNCRGTSVLRPLHQTTVSFDIKPTIDTIPYCFSPIKSKYTPLPPRIRIKTPRANAPELTIKSEIKAENEKTVDQTLLTYLNKFGNEVQCKFSAIFSELDRMNKGSFDIDDIIDYFVLKNLEKQSKNYEKIRIEAGELQKTFELVSGSKVTNLRFFFGFCSVFEYNRGKEFDLTNREFVHRMRNWILEMKELFECFTDKKVLDLKAILAEICLKERILKARKFVEREKIDFCRFLKCLPFFVWIYNAVNNNM